MSQFRFICARQRQKAEVPEAAKRPRAVLLFAAKNILLGLSNNQPRFVLFFSRK